jgi:hypothetical protein
MLGFFFNNITKFEANVSKKNWGRKMGPNLYLCGALRNV